MKITDVSTCETPFDVKSRHPCFFLLGHARPTYTYSGLAFISPMRKIMSPSFTAHWSQQKWASASYGVVCYSPCKFLNLWHFSEPGVVQEAWRRRKLKTTSSVFCSRYIGCSVFRSKSFKKRTRLLALLKFLQSWKLNLQHPDPRT
jgi:hypothetical protein